MASDQNFAKKVAELYRENDRLPAGGEVVQELGPGIVVIQDWLRQYDVLFDGDRWSFAEPGRWDIHQSSELLEIGVRIMPGTAFVPAPKSLEQAARSAKMLIGANKDAQWHSRPLPILL